MLIATNPSANPGMDWAYFAPIPHYSIKFLPHGENKYELVIMVRSRLRFWTLWHISRLTALS